MNKKQKVRGSRGGEVSRGFRGFCRDLVCFFMVFPSGRGVLYTGVMVFSLPQNPGQNPGQKYGQQPGQKSGQRFVRNNVRKSFHKPPKTIKKQDFTRFFFILNPLPP